MKYFGGSLLNVLLNSTVEIFSLIFIPGYFAMLRFDLDFCPSWTRNSMSRSLFADSNLLQDFEPQVFNLKGPENDRSSID
ncbi:hypothetical protein ACTXT7_011710 [Hymenolepis weldensis]